MAGLEIGQLLDNRYEIKTVFLDGRLSTIWQAYDRHMERDVAIKTMNSPDRSTRIYNEVIKSAALEHPHLTPLYDYSMENDVAYLVMRLISNVRLSDIIESQSLDIDFVLKIATKLADAVDYLHDQRLVHGDIRPSNILLDEQSQPYLTNLALATVLENDGLASNVGMGSRFYMAPEQLTAPSIGFRADVFAFGILIFEMLTGQLPFGHDQIQDSFAARLHSNPEQNLPSLKTFRDDLPLAVDLVLNRLTRYTPSERYASAAHAMRDLSNAFYAGQSNIEGKIFISYARKDETYVHRLANELRRIGLDIWIDRGIRPGSHWDEAIETALNDCDIMLLIATEASMRSEYVMHEWSYFMGGGKPVYPFIPQEPIPDNIHPRLQRVQHVVGTDDMLNNVARIIDVLANI